MLIKFTSPITLLSPTRQLDKILHFNGNYIKFNYTMNANKLEAHLLFFLFKLMGCSCYTLHFIANCQTKLGINVNKLKTTIM